MKRILLVEDDQQLLEGLEYNLSRAGFEMLMARDGEEGLRMAQRDAPDLVLLDLMLPKRSGFEVLEELVSQGASYPIFLLSARSQEADKLRGFDLGAVDYLTKPFSVGELIARIRVRLQERSPAGRFGLGNLRIDLERFLVEGGGRTAHLTPTEVAILRELRRAPGHPVARETLLSKVWNLGCGMTRTLDAHIARLRKKIEEDPAAPVYLQTVRGVGYVLLLVPSPEAEA